MLKKYENTREVLNQESRYVEVSYKEAIDREGKVVEVVDDRRKQTYTEAQVDEQLAKWQNLKDEITALKSDRQ